MERLDLSVYTMNCMLAGWLADDVMVPGVTLALPQRGTTIKGSYGEGMLSWTTINIHLFQNIL